MKTILFPNGLRWVAVLILILTALAPVSAIVQADEAALDGVISAGAYHACALTSYGAVDCWGAGTTNTGTYPNYGQAEDQPGPYTQVSAGDFHTCALTPAGAVDCWGLYGYGQAEDQPGPYTQVSAAGSHTCALTPTGAIDCWGRNFRGQLDGTSDNNPHPTPITHPGPYTQVSAGGIQTCALTPSGAVDCWGVNWYGEADDHSGPYTQVSTGEYHTCALATTGSVDCWGLNNDGVAEDQPGPYTQLSAGYHHNCALKSTGALECWGSNVFGEGGNLPGPYTQISGGRCFTCALTPTGAVDCWGAGTTNTGAEPHYGQAEDQLGPFGPYSGIYNFTGFALPVDNNGVLNIAKAGQTIPLKWRITDASGNPVTNLTSVTATALNLSCSAGTTTDQIEEYTSGASGLQNLGDGYYQWNWKTPASYANSCKTLELDLGEGAGYEHIALFQFKK